VRGSLVLLKNDKANLAAEESAARIHARPRRGRAVHACGGWTISWQGKLGTPIPGGTSILSALKSTVSKDTKVTNFQKTGTGRRKGADVGVLVVG